MKTIECHIKNLIKFLQHFGVKDFLFQEVEQGRSRQTIIEILEQLRTGVNILLMLIVNQVHLRIILSQDIPQTQFSSRICKLHKWQDLTNISEKTIEFYDIVFHMFQDWGIELTQVYDIWIGGLLYKHALQLVCVCVEVTVLHAVVAIGEVFWCYIVIVQLPHSNKPIQVQWCMFLTRWYE